MAEVERSAGPAVTWRAGYSATLLKMWSAPAQTLCTARSHQCSAVMPFGEIVEHPAEKNKLPMAERLKVYLD